MAIFLTSFLLFIATWSRYSVPDLFPTGWYPPCNLVSSADTAIISSSSSSSTSSRCDFCEFRVDSSLLACCALFTEKNKALPSDSHSSDSEGDGVCAESLEACDKARRRFWACGAAGRSPLDDSSLGPSLSSGSAEAVSSGILGDCEGGMIHRGRHTSSSTRRTNHLLV